MNKGNVLNKVTKEYISNVILEEFIPDLMNNTTDWLINPDVTNVIGLDTSLWQIDLDTNNNLVRVRRMTKQELDTYQPLLQQVKVLQKEFIDNACTDGIVGGVLSNALGTPHVYDASVIDQLNIIAAIATISPSQHEPQGGTILYACRDPLSRKKVYLPHTYSQLRTVLSDGALIKLTQLIRATTKKTMIDVANSVSRVKKITWDSNP